MIVSIVQGTAVIAAYNLTDGMIISDDGSKATLGGSVFEAPEGCILVAPSDPRAGIPGDSYDPATGVITADPARIAAEDAAAAEDDAP